MAIASPFLGLQFPPALVCEFFAVFSRFEYALKESGFVRTQKGFAEAAWWGFSAKAAKALSVEPGSQVAQAIEFLVGAPPMVQVSQAGWEHRPLHGATQIEQALDAVTRVRNNLFHGGKHTAHSPPGRDEALVQWSLVLLNACLEQDKGLRATYEQNAF